MTPSPLNREVIVEQLEAAEDLKNKLEADILRRIKWSPKQWQALNSQAREVALCGLNQGGKSFTLRAWIAYHATGRYPHQWIGKKFDRPVTIMAGGEDTESTQKLLSNELLGAFGERGSGMIPADTFSEEDIVTKMGGVKHSVDTVKIRHETDGEFDGYSKIIFYSYSQGREKLQGGSPDLIGVDEEPPMDVYDELSARLLHTRGSMLLSFTPMKGYTQLYNKFAESKDPYYELITFGVGDVLHETEEHRDERWARYGGTPQERPRLHGLPTAGEGAVFTVSESEILTRPIPIPRHWKQIIGIDLAHTTGTFAAAKLAIDPESKTVYLVAASKVKGKPFPVHVEIMRKLGGEDIPIAWPHDGMRIHDGRPIVDNYRRNHLNMLRTHAHYRTSGGMKSNSIGAMIQDLQCVEFEGRFKVFDTCHEYMKERSTYSTKDGEVIKRQEDHMIDAVLKAIAMLRYASAGEEFEPPQSWVLEDINIFE